MRQDAIKPENRISPAESPVFLWQDSWYNQLRRMKTHAAAECCKILKSIKFCNILINIAFKAGSEMMQCCKIWGNLKNYNIPKLSCFLDSYLNINIALEKGIPNFAFHFQYFALRVPFLQIWYGLFSLHKWGWT